MTGEGSLFSTTGGSYSLEARLQAIKSRLFDVNKKVRELESNMIFLLVNPELTYTTTQSSNSSNNQGTSDIDGSQNQGQVLSSQQVDFGQEQYLTNPAELDDKLSQNLGSRHALMVTEEEILAAIHERDKEKDYEKQSHKPDNLNDDSNAHFGFQF